MACLFSGGVSPGSLNEAASTVVHFSGFRFTSVSFLFSAVSAVVVDVGATISHAVIVARELGVPCVTSATNATSLIPDGALIEVNGSSGTVTILE